MSSFDLLDAVLPAEGRYCVVGIGRYVDQNFYDSRQEADEQTAKLVKRGFNAYFGCAKYGDADNRTHENALHFRALWMDIDCGPTKATPDKNGIVKGYIDQATGLNELIKFCSATNLPRPVLVNSGYGIHAYWLLEEVLDRAQWTPLANRLRQLCAEQGLIVDSAVFEPSRILRIPGTPNFKGEEPVEVSVLYETTERIPYEAMRKLLGAPEPKEETPDFIPRSMSPMMEALLANKVKRFKTIMLKAENGCPQLNYCFANQAELDEPLWQSALSIAAFCVDGDRAAHKMSNQYPDYDPTEVDLKLMNIRKRGGPHHCTTFEERNPNGCDGCIHKGKIKSPIVLGIEIEEADEADNEVTVEEEGGGEQKYTIPEYPFPFFRGKKGGIYVRPVQEDEEAEPKLVYEHDLYVVKRMRDKELGEVALFRLHLPHDGVKEFSVTTAAISSKDELRKQLAQQGVMAHHKQYENLATFVITSVKNLQYTKKADIMRTQFGWVEGD
ncbi:DUF927 domain-containing protein, partial [bacterium]|nr:DUF927 domain-containing protein [bacterium]